MYFLFLSTLPGQNDLPLLGRKFTYLGLRIAEWNGMDIAGNQDSYIFIHFLLH